MKKISKESIKSVLKFILEKKEENTISSYPSIKNALYSYQIPFSFITLEKGTPLFRLRSHDEIFSPFDKNCLTKISEVGPIPDCFKVNSFGRANEPLQSVFYCSTLREVAFLETSKIAKNYDLKEEVYSISEWILTRNINLATFPINDQNKNKNIIAQKLDLEFRELIKEFDKEEKSISTNFLDILSKEFSHISKGKENDYLISAAFANYIFDHYGQDYSTKQEVEMDGLVYPSVQYESEGVNLALKNSLIWDKSLELKVVVCQKMENLNKKNWETDSITSKNIDYQKWIIEW